ncbi:MAG: YfhO family protein [Candidatus Margulisiibacteriota bacterium]
MKKNLVVSAFFLLLTVLFFWRFLDGSQVFVFKDLSRYFYPLRYLMVEQVRSGHLPLWNPYIFCGMPLLASHQICFFYPLTIIYYILPFDLAFNYYIIIHYFLAACFMYLAMRHFKLGRLSAVFSAVVFAFSGYLLSVSNMNTTLSSVIWMPLVFMFFDAYITRFKVKDFLAVCLLLSLMFLGGEPTILYITGACLFFYAVFIPERKVKSLFSLIVMAVFMVLLTAAQFLPFVELGALSDRKYLTDISIVARWSLPVRELLTFIFPFFFGSQLRYGQYNSAILGSHNQSWLLSAYVGFLPLLLSFLAVCRADKRRVFFCVAGTLGLLLALGKYTPFYLLLYKTVPGISLIRYPVKFSAITFFSIAFLGGFGLQDLVGRLKKEGVFFKRLSILLLSLAGFCSLLLLTVIANKQRVFFLIKQWWGRPLTGFYEQTFYDILNFDMQSLLVLTVILAAAAVIFWLYREGKLSSTVFLLLFVVMVSLDLFSSNQSVSFSGRRAVYDEVTPNIKLLQKDRGLFRFFYTSELGDANRMLWGEDYNKALLESKDRLTPDKMVPYGLYDFDGYESVLLAQFREYATYFYGLEGGYPKKLIDMSNAKYVASERPLGWPGLKLLRAASGDGGRLYLYFNHFHMPRAYMASEAKTMFRDNILAYMQGGDFDPERTVILEEEAGLQKKQAGYKLDILKYAPAEIVLKYDSKGDQFLFLSESYYPGWKAYIDGKETKILRANYMFRAVVAPAGSHVVKFNFSPLSFRVGSFISLAAITVFALLWYLKRNEEIIG